jgi:DoxX
VVGASVIAPLVSVLAAVLVVAGLGKLRAPAAAADAMRAAGMPAGAIAARLVGLAETSVGVLVLVVPSRPSLGAMAALYVILGCFAVRLLRTAAPVTSCGCFGADAPPSPLHAGFDGAAAALAVLAIASPPPGLPELAARAPVAGVGLVAGCCASAYAVSLVLRHLPAAASAYRPGRGAA